MLAPWRGGWRVAADRTTSVIRQGRVRRSGSFRGDGGAPPVLRGVCNLDWSALHGEIEEEVGRFHAPEESAPLRSLCRRPAARWVARESVCSTRPANIFSSAYLIVGNG
jgi:hypothetical protein